jgi:16S rRNA processing protein RimM
MKLLEIGRTVKPHGLKGCLRAVSYFESNGPILPTMKAVYLRQGQGDSQLYPLKDAKMRGDHFLLQLEGIDDEAAAKTLVGCQVLIPTDTLMTPPDDEYYWHELMDMEVVTEEGQTLGRIAGIFPTGSNDVFICRGGEREILLPSIGDVIRSVDRQQRVVTVRLLDGL